MGIQSESSEHILVCISPSPSNPKVVSAAARMAEAFQATLTAVYVKPTNYEALPEGDRARLQNNIRFAERNGASVTTIVGDDVPSQVAEYARISDTTKIVVGRSGMKRRHFWSRTPLTEQIILNVPDLDVYIIPDSAVDFSRQKERSRVADSIRPTLKELIVTLLLMAAATLIGLVFLRSGFSEANIITVFILGVLLVSVVTVSPLFGVLGSLAGVLLFNWFFIEPRYSFHTYETEYAVTFAIMLASSLITGTLANRIKQNGRHAAREAFRTKVLLDTNQLLQKAENPEEAIRVTARQIITLLNRDVVIYSRSESGGLGDRAEFGVFRSEPEPAVRDENEREICEWVFANRQSAGAHLERFGKAGAQYHPICLNGCSYGVLVIRLNGGLPDTFENSIMMSMLGECALALENLRNAEEKERASVMMSNEQLRANLLRSISHDIRTPLTSVSGNASNLLAHYKQLDDRTLEQIFSDIYDDSEWLIDLVENLLSISRIENGQMELHRSLEVMDDVIEEALKHADREAKRHHISIEPSEEILLVNMDAGLIMQVLINLINNAVKNTPEGSEITVRSERKGEWAVVSVTDNGPGIPDAIKDQVFEMFFTGRNKVADGRRGLGLGLALCKSIVEAHNGRITLTDNEPTGCRFTVELPVKEVRIDE